MERKNAWEKYPQGEKRDALFAFAEEYRKFISECKTERECATYVYELAKKEGFIDLDEAIAAGTALKAGDKVMANNMGKGLAMFILGKKGLEEGMNILGAHIDSPRIDLKQVPLFEDTEIERLNGRADVRNIASNKVMQKCGFVKEGTVRQGKMVSVYCDYNIYGMLREDYMGMQGISS